MGFQWGAVNRPKFGQSVSGDAYVIQEIAEQKLLVAVIDGLGGGEEAARAAQAAALVLQQFPEYPLEHLIRQAHLDLRTTRGAVMAILRLDGEAKQATFIGVGNIGIQVYSQRQIRPISKNGILGYRMPTLLEFHHQYDAEDTFVLYSDGISGRFSQDEKFDRTMHPQQLAEAILDSYGKMNDDATVVVVRDT